MICSEQHQNLPVYAQYYVLDQALYFASSHWSCKQGSFGNDSGYKCTNSNWDRHYAASSSTNWIDQWYIALSKQSDQVIASQNVELICCKNSLVAPPHDLSLIFIFKNPQRCLCQMLWILGQEFTAKATDKSKLDISKFSSELDDIRKLIHMRWIWGALNHFLTWFWKVNPNF